MKYLYIVIICISTFCTTKIKAEPNAQPEPVVYSNLQKVWMIKQIYFDSVYSSLDTITSKYRLILANNSVCYLNDGKQEWSSFWHFDPVTNDLIVFLDKTNIAESILLHYKIVYSDDQNLILTLDVTQWNFPVKSVEYRLVPDFNFFAQHQ